jgi:precorrin-2 dehydrogenase/sirohydrochlorin ferrochelatase
LFCNVVDQPEQCDFYTPAVVRRGDLQIAIGADGNCPAYAGHLRQKLEDVFTQTHGEFLQELEAIRKKVLQDISNADEQKALLGRLASDESFEVFHEQGRSNWKEYAHAQMTACHV